MKIREIISEAPLPDDWDKAVYQQSRKTPSLKTSWRFPSGRG